MMLKLSWLKELKHAKTLLSKKKDPQKIERHNL